MTHSETFPKQLHTEAASVFFLTLERLPQPERAVLQAIVYFFPSSVTLNFLQEHTELNSSKISRALKRINLELEKHTSYRVAGSVTFKLEKQLSVPSNRALFSSLSQAQRDALHIVLSGKSTTKIDRSILYELSKKLEDTVIGSINKDSSGQLYFESNTVVSNQQLLEELQRFQVWNDSLPKPSL